MSLNFSLFLVGKELEQEPELEPPEPYQNFYPEPEPHKN
jgi:hypothetical protein